MKSRIEEFEEKAKIFMDLYEEWVEYVSEWHPDDNTSVNEFIVWIKDNLKSLRKVG